MEVRAEHGDEVTFIGVPGLSESLGSMERFVVDGSVDDFPHVPDTTSDLWERFGITEQRRYVFVNQDGTTRTTGYGDLEAEVEALIER